MMETKWTTILFIIDLRKRVTLVNNRSKGENEPWNVKSQVVFRSTEVLTNMSNEYGKKEGAITNNLL